MQLTLLTNYKIPMILFLTHALKPPKEFLGVFSLTALNPETVSFHQNDNSPTTGLFISCIGTVPGILVASHSHFRNSPCDCHSC